MESWWSELDGEIVRCLAEGPMDPAEIGRRLGVSEAAVTSLVPDLAREHRVRICLVAAGPQPADIAAYSFWCSGRGQRVTAEFHEDPLTGKRRAVNWCSVFSPPTVIECDRRCLELEDPVTTRESPASRAAS